MNIAKMMKQAQQMQAKMQQIQQDLAQRRYEASAGGGTIQAVVNGAGDLVSLTISPTVIRDAADDPTLLADLILTAIQEATAKAKSEAAAEMNKIASGLGLPGI
jgi:DNA-binding YbaB/EbfC family protein